MIAKPIQWGIPDDDDFVRSLSTFALGVYSFDQGASPVTVWFQGRDGNFTRIGDFANIPKAKEVAQKDFDNRVAELLSDHMIQAAYWGYDRYPNDVPEVFGSRIERLRDERFPKK